MLSKKLSEALNAQINTELWSAYIYCSMSNWALDAGYEGIAHWFRLQAREEQDHAERLADYIRRQGGKVFYRSIADVPNDWGSPIDLFLDAAKHEEMITKNISNLMQKAMTEGDFATQVFLQWFVTEQVEEEDSLRAILTDLRKIGTCECGCGLHLIDRELLQRSK
ncbi:MAG: ferritin [Paludibacteraceae bacterium]|nr:ferritin [Paludibacteraceae bacterium]